MLANKTGRIDLLVLLVKRKKTVLSPCDVTLFPLSS